MHRLATATLLLWMAACSAPKPQPATAVAGPVPSLLPAPVPSGESAPLSEAQLRAELASADDPAPAALELGRRLDAEERLGEALLILDTARARKPQDPALLVARAGVLRDLGRRREALRDLAAAIAAAVDPVQPGLLFEWAELAAFDHQQEEGQRALLRLRSGFADSSFVATHADEITQLERALVRDEALEPVRVRDLLGDLRGSASADRRGEAFALLQRAGGAIAARAVAVILADSDPHLRSRGVISAEVGKAQLVEFCAIALADPSPLVRTAGAGRAAALPAEDAAALLLPTLAAETDAPTFVALHTALRRATGTAVDLDASAVNDPAARAAVVAEWRRQWER